MKCYFCENTATKRIHGWKSHEWGFNGMTAPLCDDCANSASVVEATRKWMRDEEWNGPLEVENL